MIRFLRHLSVALILLALNADAGLINQSGPRLFVSGGGGGPGDDVLFAMDMSGSPQAGSNWSELGGGWNDPNGGYGVYVDVTRQAGVGPGGIDCYRWTLIPTALTEETTVGFSGRIPVADWAAGETLYFSFRYRPLSTNTLTRNHKLIINVMDGNGGDARPILHLQDWDSGYVWRAAQGGGGGASTQTTPVVAHNSNTFENIQWAVRVSSDASTADGQHRLWRNNNVEGSPTMTWNPGEILPPAVTTGTDTGLGLYALPIPVGESQAFDVCDFQIRRSFRSM